MKYIRIFNVRHKFTYAIVSLADEKHYNSGNGFDLFTKWIEIWIKIENTHSNVGCSLNDDMAQMDILTREMYLDK